MTISSVEDAKILLYALARDDAVGTAFREHVIYASTTFIGDGTNVVNGVGHKGDRVFIREMPTGNFSCSGPNEYVCGIIAPLLPSTKAACLDVEANYQSCILMGFAGSKWSTNCGRLQTSMSAALSGIQCDKEFVYGHPHPYVKSRGNILYSMMYSM